MYRIFIIEDEVWPFTKKYIESIFGGDSVEIHIAASMRTALFKIWEFYKKRRFPDLALIDVRLLKLDIEDKARGLENILYGGMDFHTFVHQFDEDTEYLKFQESILDYQNEDGDMFVHGGLYLWSKLHSMAIKSNQKMYSVIYSASTTIHNQASWLKELDFITFMDKSLLGRIVEVNNEDHEDVLADKITEIKFEIFKSLYDQKGSNLKHLIEECHEKEISLIVPELERVLTFNPFSFPSSYTELVKHLDLDEEMFIRDVKLEEHIDKDRRIEVTVICAEVNPSEENSSNREIVSLGKRKVEIDISEIEEDIKLVKKIFNEKIIDSKIMANNFSFGQLRDLNRESFHQEILQKVQLSGAPNSWTFATLFPTYYMEIEEIFNNPRKSEGQKLSEAYLKFKEVKNRWFPDCYGRDINYTFAEGAIYSVTHGYAAECHDGTHGRKHQDKIDRMAMAMKNDFFERFVNDSYVEESNIKDMKFENSQPSAIRDAINIKDSVDINIEHLQIKDHDNRPVTGLFDFLRYKNYINHIDPFDIYTPCENSIILRINRFKEFLVQLVNDICKDRNGIANKTTSMTKEFTAEKHRQSKTIRFYFFDDGQYILNEDNLTHNSTITLFRRYRLAYEINWYTVTRLYGQWKMFQQHLQNVEDISGDHILERFGSLFPHVSKCFAGQVDDQPVTAFPSLRDKQWNNLHIVEFFYGHPVFPENFEPCDC